MARSLKKIEVRDINWVRNLPAMNELIKSLRDESGGAFGRAWNKTRGSPLYGSHILLMTEDEVVSVYGKKEPFKVAWYLDCGSSESRLFGRVAAILAAYGVQIEKTC